MIGRIIKGIAGFYYIHDGKRSYECKAKGILRLKHDKPLVGDNVVFDIVSEEEGTGNITGILPRKNQLIRPEIANTDQIFLVFSAASPEPNYDMLNRYLVMVHDTGIPVHFVVNKTDLREEKDLERLREEFRNTGYPMHFISAKTSRGIPELLQAMEGKVTALAGPSGVGKSSLMNGILEEEVTEVGDLSKKIDRGKNTTRHSEIFCISEDTYVFDTPGFTSVEFDSMLPEELQYAFDEFVPYISSCKYLTSCRHLKERECDCAVKRAVSDGRISGSRYASYTAIYEYLNNIKRY